MSDDEHRSVKLTKRAFQELCDLRDELLQKGTEILPKELLDLQDQPSRGRISLSFVCEAGVKAIRSSMKKK